jgi:hypothetical protein
MGAVNSDALGYSAKTVQIDGILDVRNGTSLFPTRTPATEDEISINASGQLGFFDAGVAKLLPYETGFWNKETRDVQHWACTAAAGEATYDGTADAISRSLPDAASTLAGARKFVIPSWYLKSGSNVFSLVVGYYVNTIPGSTKSVSMLIAHRAWVAGDASWGSWNYTGTTISVPTTGTTNSPRTTTLNVTTPDIGGSKTHLEVWLYRDGTGIFGTDDYVNVLAVTDIGLQTGVKTS